MLAFTDWLEIGFCPSPAGLQMCTNINKFLFSRSNLPKFLVANGGAQLNWTWSIFKFRLKPWVNAVLAEGLSFLVTKILSLARAVSWILFPAALELEEWIILLMPLHRLPSWTSWSTRTALLPQEMSVEQLKAWNHFQRTSRPAVQGKEADPIYTGRADVPCLVVL